MGTILGHTIIGKGNKAIFVLHELMGDCRNYEPSFAYLNTQEFTYVFIDHRGYGKSKEIVGQYSCEEAAYDISGLITHLGFKEVYLTAHSMSTMIAQKAALLDKRIIQLNLITPISAEGIKMKPEAKEKMLLQMQQNESKIEEIVESASKRYNDTWRQYRIDMAYTSSVLEARVGYMKMYLEADFLQEAQEGIDIPIKILTGAEDFPVFSKTHVQKLFKGYKDVEIVECAVAGHYPMIECPVLFATQLEKWCKESLTD